MSVREQRGRSGTLRWVLAAAIMGIPLAWIGAQVTEEPLYRSVGIDLHDPQGRESSVVERRGQHERPTSPASNQGNKESTKDLELSSAGTKSHRKLGSHAPLLTSVLPY
jgi:hypothetical protein